MNKDKVIQELYTDYDLIANYILNDLQPYEWKPLKYVKQIEPFGINFIIPGDEDLTLFEIQDRTMEDEYKYTLLIEVGWKSNRPQKALIKLKSNYFLLIEFN